MTRSRCIVLVGIALSISFGCTRSTRAPTDAGTDAPFMVGFDAMIDVGRACDPGMIDCFGTCTRVAGDSNNCGSCGNRCPEGVSCANGYCDCLEPLTSCDGICLDPSADPANCGTCGNVCSDIEMCTDGTCIIDCDPPNMICYERDAKDMEVAVCADPMTNANHCGRCNTRCSGGATCRTGRCQCPLGWLNCDGACVDPATDAANCGSCRVSCGPGGVCVDSSCMTCGGGLTACGGRCVDTDTDRFHCGTCDRPCGLMESCTAGTCDCSAGLTDCPATGGCTDLDTDVRNCGACGTDCGPGGVCSAGTCTCAAGYMMCGASCRDTRSDRNNCGMCGRVCPTDWYCVTSACTDECMTFGTPAGGYQGCRDTIPATTCPDIRTTGTIACSGDDCTTPITMPFPFTFFGTARTSWSISSNGKVGFPTTAIYSNTCTIENDTIAVFWDDLYPPTGGSVRYQTMGTAPNRQLVVQWNVPHIGGGSLFDIRAVLYEGSNDILMCYVNTSVGMTAYDSGASATVGIQGGAGTGLQFSCNTPMVPSGTVLRFVAP